MDYFVGTTQVAAGLWWLLSATRFWQHGCWCSAAQLRRWSSEREWDKLGNDAVGCFTIASLQRQTPLNLPPHFFTHLPTAEALQGHHRWWVVRWKTSSVRELFSAVLCWLSCCQEQVLMMALVTTAMGVYQFLAFSTPSAASLHMRWGRCLTQTFST